MLGSSLADTWNEGTGIDVRRGSSSSRSSGRSGSGSRSGSGRKYEIGAGAGAGAGAVVAVGSSNSSSTSTSSCSGSSSSSHGGRSTEMCDCFEAAGVSTQIDQSTKSFGYSASALLLVQKIHL